MDKTKSKKNSIRKNRKERKKIKDYAMQRIETLSWVMGEKSYSSREELYDR